MVNSGTAARRSVRFVHGFDDGERRAGRRAAVCRIPHRVGVALDLGDDPRAVFATEPERPSAQAVT